MRKSTFTWLSLSVLLLGTIGLSLYFRRPVEYRSDQFLMDTLVSIRVFGSNEVALRDAVREAYAEMHRIADLTDRFPAAGSAACTASNVCRINEMAGIKPVRVDEDVFAMLEMARHYHDLTDGAFDVTIGPVMSLWGFGGKEPRVPGDDEIKASLGSVNNDNMRLDAQALSVFLEKNGMILDLGAVAKGYATEKAVQVLKKHGIKKALIDAGGTIRVIGNNVGNTPWKIGIKNPVSMGDIVAVLSLTDMAAVTSGDYYRYFEAKGRRWNHIIDPRTGYPATANKSVTVVADSAAFADVLSTALFVLEPEKALESARKLGVEVFIVRADGRILCSPTLQRRMELFDAAGRVDEQSR